ncbi:long-chain fatty acid--CoA ligase [Gordonia sp. TBRC 11910]|uniref:Long-chain fatty acid--CoA ligase n=1 Tax=Gordonia asplenii TaxID=2725283 RepID=A0A848KZH1_9ACTN|nr:AMP-binding protein [Gordonia asplenii]NMO03612.1 long-chain fatty acid--CoA ligase [Gordonia asplenii]
MYFADVLRETVGRRGANIAVAAPGRLQTYAELGERAYRLANALTDLGLRPGDRVGMLSDNSIHVPEQIAALAVAGLVRAPLYTQNTAATNTYLARNTGMSVILVEAKYAAALAAELTEPDDARLVLVDDGTGASVSGALDYEAVIAAASTSEPPVHTDVTSPHIIRFSAGTTGRPKGIVHSAQGLQAIANELFTFIDPPTEEDVFLAAGTLSHATGYYVWPLIAAGARITVMPQFDPTTFLSLVESERATLTMAVPTMIQVVASVAAAAERPYDVSSMRAIYYGASPITDATLRAGLELFGPIMYQVYGQSEAVPSTFLAPSEHHLEGEFAGRLRSAGRPTVNSEITIRDGERVLPVGTIGEICVKTPGAMLGIWGDDAATAARFTADGAVRSRDVGHFDEHGFLYLDARLEDVIISGGYNVYPAEIENALAEHPAISEAAVVGIPHEKWGETVAAVVILEPGTVAGEDELIDWARARVGPVRKPTVVVIADEPLPKNAVGKIPRAAVRERYWPGTPDIVGA